MLNSNLNKIKSAYTVRKTITSNKIFNTTNWEPITELSYTVPQKSIVVALGSMEFSRNTNGAVEFFFDNCHFAFVDLVSDVRRLFTPQLVKIADAGKQFTVTVGSNSNWTTTIHASSDNRYAYIDYLVIPLE